MTRVIARRALKPIGLGYSIGVKRDTVWALYDDGTKAVWEYARWPHERRTIIEHTEFLAGELDVAFAGELH